MSLSAHLQRWSGDALRHIPAGARYDVLDFRYAGRGNENRWNDHGQPTLYLAGDDGVLIAEWGRHFAVNRTPGLQQKTQEREVFRLTLALDAVLDLRDAAVWQDLSLTDAPHCFLDLPTARATANFIRQSTKAQGLIVPSAAFLDDLDRWCLVVFLEKFPDERTFITAVRPAGRLGRA